MVVGPCGVDLIVFTSFIHDQY